MVTKYQLTDSNSEQDLTGFTFKLQNKKGTLVQINVQIVKKHRWNKILTILGFHRSGQGLPLCDTF